MHVPPLGDSLNSNGTGILITVFVSPADLEAARANLPNACNSPHYDPCNPPTFITVPSPPKPRKRRASQSIFSTPEDRERYRKIQQTRAANAARNPGGSSTRRAPRVASRASSGGRDVRPNNDGDGSADAGLYFLTVHLAEWPMGVCSQVISSFGRQLRSQIPIFQTPFFPYRLFRMFEVALTLLIDHIV